MKNFAHYHHRDIIETGLKKFEKQLKDQDEMILAMKTKFNDLTQYKRDLFKEHILLSTQVKQLNQQNSKVKSQHLKSTEDICNCTTRSITLEEPSKDVSQ